MSDPNEKLEHFTSLIMDDAEKECAKIRDEIELVRTKKLTSAEDDCLSESFRFIRNEITRIKTETGQRVSRKVLDNKRILHNRRDEIAASVFSDVYKRIEEYVNTPEYLLHLKKSIASTIEQIGQVDMIVYLREADMKHESALVAEFANVKITIKPANFTLGGLVIDCPAKKIHIDETFDSSINDLSGHFAELFGISLSV